MKITDIIGTTDAGAAPVWHKAKATQLPSRATAGEALGDIIVASVEHLRANEACVMARAHDEGVHQMRVACRRMRSSLALYREYLPPEQFAYLNGELKWLIGEMGPARDWDVFLADVLAPVAKDVGKEPALKLVRAVAGVERDKAYERAQAALSSQRYRGLALLLRAWAEGRQWREGATDEQIEALTQPAGAFSQAVLQQDYDRILKAGEGLETMSVKQRHKLRIEIKRIRYAIEFFGSLYPKRAVDALLAPAKQLQDSLGADNDISVARDLIARVGKAEKGKRRLALGLATGLLVGWHARASKDLERRVGDAWHQFVTAPLFWQTSTLPRPAARAVPRPPARPTPRRPALASAQQRPTPAAAHSTDPNSTETESTEAHSADAKSTTGKE